MPLLSLIQQTQLLKYNDSSRASMTVFLQNKCTICRILTKYKCKVEVFLVSVSTQFRILENFVL